MLLVGGPHSASRHGRFRCNRALNGGHVDTIEKVVTTGWRRRRHYSVFFKAEAVSACQQPGVSIAAMALARGLNANLLRRGVQAAGRGDAPQSDSTRGTDQHARPVPDHLHDWIRFDRRLWLVVSHSVRQITATIAAEAKAAFVVRVSGSNNYYSPTPENFELGVDSALLTFLKNWKVCDSTGYPGAPPARPCTSASERCANRAQTHLPTTSRGYRLTTRATPRR